MSSILIRGGSRLNGSVRVQGSKNSTLPVMAASLLNRGITVIRNYPDIADVQVMQEILEYIGCTVYRENDEMVIDTRNAEYRPIPTEIAVKLRASSILMGPMLSRFTKVQIAPPGGCLIGARPLDIHMEAFERLGAYWENSEKEITVTARRLVGNQMTLRFPSVGATENAIMAAVCAEGETVIKNAALEPEIIQLCNYLRAAGADISDDGANEIMISGVRHLHDCEYTVAADRIVAGTYIAAVAACGGKVQLQGCTVNDCTGYLDVYTGMGVDFDCNEDGIMVQMTKRPQNLNYIVTEPYPKFPTDMQSITLSVATISEGTLKIYENIFENRFKIVDSLKKMGAQVSMLGSQCAEVTGVAHINGAEVEAADLRGAAALVIAGLCADGITRVNNADYIRRGYADLVENLRKLGAEIQWEYNERKN